ncbi:MAG: hypothetical protein WD314_08925 [Trueperaceae bacterium]
MSLMPFEPPLTLVAARAADLTRFNVYAGRPAPGTPGPGGEIVRC